MTTTKDSLPELPELPPHDIEEWSESYITFTAGWGKEAVQKYAVDYALAALASKQAPADNNQATWCGYIAGMIGTYLRWPIDDPRLDAVASIIERRLYVLPSAQAKPEPAASDRDAPPICELIDALIESVFCDKVGIDCIEDAEPDTFKACQWFKRGYRAALPEAQAKSEPAELTEEQLEAAVSAWFTYTADNSDNFTGRMRAAIAATQEQKPS